MKLSVITINRNNAEGLERTIKSVVDQTYSDYEYIVIDGNSSDSSVDVIKRYADDIDFWVSEPDKNVYNAMNKGIAKATGEYCIFLNSGDHFYDKDAIGTMIHRGTGEDVLYSDVLNVTKSHSYRQPYPDKLTAGYFFRGCLAHPTCMIKRRLFDVVGLYDESFKITADHDFFQKAFCLHNASYKYIPVLTSVFYMDGLSSNPENQELMKQEHFASCKKNLPFYFDDFEFLDDVRHDSLLEFHITHRKSKIVMLCMKVLRKISCLRKCEKK